MAFAAVAEAAPQVHPDLAQLLSGSGSESSRLHIAIEFPPSAPSQEEALLNRQGQQWRLMQRSLRNEQSLREKIQGLNAMSFQSIRLRNFWISNVVFLEAPKLVLRQLLPLLGDVRVRRPQKFHLLKPRLDSRSLRFQSSWTPALEKLRLPELQQAFPRLDGTGIRVGILDSGVNTSHPDLKDKVIKFKNFIEDGSPRPDDDLGHGTHVAGTLVGGAASGVRIGVAPGARLIVGKIFDEDGVGNEDEFLAAMQWIADPDGDPRSEDAPQLVNNSWVSDMPGGSPADKPICVAVENWVKLGILPVFAAGNYGPVPQSVSLPAACPGSVSVGATELNDEVAWFSSRGPAKWGSGPTMHPIVSAPGVEVYSAAKSGGYLVMSGTSMATPHVTGFAALLFQAKGPKSSVAEITRLLEASTVDLGTTGQDPVFGFGRMDFTRVFSKSAR